MKKILILGLVAMVGLMSSCSEENPTTDNRSKGVVTIEIISPAMSSTKATEPGTEPENKIENLKIFVLSRSFNPQTIERLYDFDPSQNHIFDAYTRWNAAKQSMEMSDDIVANHDPLMLYVFANWNPANIDDYQVGSDSERLPHQITTNQGESASPFVMSVPYAISDWSKHVRIPLFRQPIKVEMTLMLDAAFAAAYPDFGFGKLEQATPTMGVLSTPKMSRVINFVSIKDEPGFGYVNIPPKEVEQSGSGDTKSWKVQFYLYENPTDGTDGADATKFVFRLPYQKTGGNAQTDNYYTIALKTSDVAAPYKTVRNTIYRVKATLLGFGSTTPIEFENEVSTVVSVVPWNVENVDTSIDDGYVSIESIKAGISDLFNEPDYTYPTEGKPIIIQLAANVGGTRVTIIDDKGRVVAQAAPTTENTRQIELMVPHNVGIENGVPVAPRRLTLQITNFKAKIHFNSDVAVNVLQTTHAQGAVVWAEKNIGATTPQDGGYVYQYDRNVQFLLTPPLLNETVGGPVSKEDAAGRFYYKFITIPTELLNGTPDYGKMSWANGGVIDNLWQTPATNPCSTYGDQAVNWVMPTAEDYNVVQGLSHLKNPSGGAPFGWQFDVTDAKLFFPFCGIRVSDDSAIIGTGDNGGTSYWTRDIDTKLGGAKTFDIGVSRRIILNAYSTACPIRCVRYINK